MTIDEVEKEAVEQARRLLVEPGQLLGIQRAAPREGPHLGQEWLARGHEQGHGVGQARGGRREATAERRDQARRLVQGGGSCGGIHGIEVQQERLDELPPLHAEDLALLGPDERARIRRPRPVPDVAAPIRRRETVRRDAEPGQRRAVVAARADQPLQRPAPEPTVAPRRVEDLHAPLVGPPPERVRIHAHQPAGSSQRKPRRVGCGGADGGHGTRRLLPGRRIWVILGISRAPGRTVW